MDTLGATPGGGVHRLALGADDIEAHRRLAAWGTARGWTVALDDIGNMFLRRAGADPALPPVASGSHTDSQPMAGRFDGMSGVLAAFEALETIAAAQLETRHPLEVPLRNHAAQPRSAPPRTASPPSARARTRAAARRCVGGARGGRRGGGAGAGRAGSRSAARAAAARPAPATATSGSRCTSCRT